MFKHSLTALVKVYYLEDDGGCPLITAVHPELRRAQARLLAMLREECGAEVARADLPNFYYSLAIWTNSMYSEPRRSFSQELVQVGDSCHLFCTKVGVSAGRGRCEPLPGAGAVVPRPQRAHPARPPHRHRGEVRLPGVQHFQVSHQLNIAPCSCTEYRPLRRSYVRRGDVLRQELGALLGRDGVLVYPSHPTPAPFHNLPILRIFNFAYTAIFNVLGNPVTQVEVATVQ